MTVINPQATALVPAAAAGIAFPIWAAVSGGPAGLILGGYMALIWVILVAPPVTIALLAPRQLIERARSVNNTRMRLIGAGAIAVLVALMLFPPFSFLITASWGFVTGSGWSVSHFTTENALIWWHGGAPLAGLYFVVLMIVGISSTRPRQTYRTDAS